MVKHFFMTITVLYFLVTLTAHGGARQSLNYEVVPQEKNEDEYYSLKCDPERFHIASAVIRKNVRYPHIKGLANKFLAKKVNAVIKKTTLALLPTDTWPTSVQIDYEIGYESNDFISILLKFDHFLCQARHNVNGYETLNIDLNTGDILKVKDLFIENSKKTLDKAFNRSVVNNFSNPETLGRSCDDISQAEGYDNYCLNVLENDQFYFDDKVLYFPFNMYEIGAGYRDAPIVKIPISELSSILLPGGVLSTTGGGF